MFHSLWSHRLQHAWPPCPSLSPRVCSNSYPLSGFIYPSHPLSTSSPPALNISQYWGLFKWVSSSYQGAKALDLELQNRSFQWIFTGILISFRINWFHVLAVQGTLKSLIQHHSVKASILQCSAFFMVLFYSFISDFLLSFFYLIPKGNSYTLLKILKTRKPQRGKIKAPVIALYYDIMMVPIAWP